MLLERVSMSSAADLLYVGKGKNVVCCRFAVCGKGLKCRLMQICCMWERVKISSAVDLLYVGKG